MIKSGTPYESVDFLVVDVGYVAHRHAHALARFQTSDGRPSGHVYGTFKTLKYQIQALNPKTVVFCYDRGAPWRRELLADYKANRRPDGPSAIEEGAADEAIATEGTIKLPPPPMDNWTPAVEVERLLRCFPGIHLSSPDSEADDQAAWFVLKSGLVTGDGPTVLHSADRDWWSLVDDKQRVAVMFAQKPAPKAKSKDCWIHEEQVLVEMGVPAYAMSRMKALLGDTSDNIRGLEGGVRPGKRDALKVFAASEAGLKYLLGADEVPVIGRDQGPGAVPDWLEGPLLEEAARMRANYQVVDLAIGTGKVGTGTVSAGTADVANAMGVLVEFECESLLPQVEPLFAGMTRNSVR